MLNKLNEVLNMFSPFKGLGGAQSAWKGMEQISYGAHNSLLQGSTLSYGAASAWGAGAGAVYGGIDGALSYDGSFLGGAVHGAMVGGVAGAAFRGASGIYATGAGQGALKGSGAFPSSMTPTKFAWKNFADGWS